MKLRVFVYRLAAALTAFVFGVGIFNARQYFQTPEETVVAVTPLPLTKPSPLFPPPPVEPLSATVVDSKEAVQEDSEEDTSEEFNAEGYYYISDDKLPKGFKDFEYISVTTNNYSDTAEGNDYKSSAIAPEGYLRTKVPFNFTKISISQKQIAFETEKFDGVSYKFSGKFIEKGSFWKLESQTPVVKGILVKLLKGKKVAESKVSLIWYGGC